ncbi:response regulator transcription factor [soil metagenome]
MIHILLADDHSVLRRGLRLLLDREPDFEVVAEAENGRDAVRLALGGGIDLAILDITMAGMTGLDACRELKAQRPDLRCLILSMHDDERLLFEALDSGAAGYVLKSVVAHELVDACRAIMRGEPFLFPEGLRALVDRYLALERERHDHPPDLLTVRERQVVRLVAEGRSTREIAGSLLISVTTVERHRSNIYAKLGVKDRVELTHYAIRRGLVHL